MFSIISMRQLEWYLDRKRNGELDFTLLDVRSPEEFAAGHLTGAVNLPMESPEGAWRQLDQDDPVIVYCGHGSKSLMAARMLDQMGYLVMASAGGLASYRGKYYKSI
ncbi:MAG: rhodanese-like domain-containing protein [Lachnospiraceae bacterium]|nr:rhodanese-like domain-containing protein [Lachnospiraceae bacterium]